MAHTLPLEVSQEILVRTGAFLLRVERITVPIEIAGSLRAELGEIEIRDVADHAVRRQNRQATGMRVEKRHHREFVWSVGIRFAGARSALIAKCERRLIVGMTIG